MCTKKVRSRPGLTISLTHTLTTPNPNHDPDAMIRLGRRTANPTLSVATHDKIPELIAQWTRAVLNSAKDPDYHAPNINPNSPVSAILNAPASKDMPLYGKAADPQRGPFPAPQDLCTSAWRRDGLPSTRPSRTFAEVRASGLEESHWLSSKLRNQCHIPVKKHQA